MNTVPDNDWLDIWRQEQLIPPVIARENMAIFLDACQSVIPMGANDTVLDVGCGEGFLAERLRDTVREIYCVDASPRSIAVCERKFHEAANVHCRLIKHDINELSQLPHNLFSKVVVLSVVQYYDSLDGFQRLIANVADLLAPNAQILIADIPTQKSKLIADAYSTLRTGIGRGIGLPVARYLARHACGALVRGRGWRLLRYDAAQLMRICESEGYDCEIVSRVMSFNRSRIHLLLSRSPSKEASES